LETFLAEAGRTQAASASHEADRSEKAKGRKSDMHAAGESDSSVVPKKPANNDGPKASAELVEGRGLTEENASRCYRAGHSAGTPDRVDGWACERGHQCGAVRPFLSEVRAVCGSSARTDPCEGRPARAVPIAIVIVCHAIDRSILSVLDGRSLASAHPTAGPNRCQ
jgi:hypothetical protein